MLSKAAWYGQDAHTSYVLFFFLERSPRQANRKIFAKDEGEYVDFEEEK
jgi:hypothetical protein